MLTDQQVYSNAQSALTVFRMATEDAGNSLLLALDRFAQEAPSVKYADIRAKTMQWVAGCEESTRLLYDALDDLVKRFGGPGA